MAQPRWHTVAYLVVAAFLVFGGWHRPEGWHLALSIAAVVLMVPAILLRNRYPWFFLLVGAIAILGRLPILAAIGLFSYSLRHRGWRVIVAGGITLLVLAVYILMEVDHQSPPEMPPTAGETWIAYAGSAIMVVIVPLLAGSYVGVSRALVGQLDARARAAEAAKGLQAREAVLEERQRIAQEMHDSLGHRLALLTMQAGALEVNADAGAPVVRRQSELLRSTAREALQELRAAIGAINSGQNEPVPHGIRDLPELVQTARSSGAQIAFDTRIDDAALPVILDRTVYRVVQEGLTNAYRHAQGEPVSVVIDRTEDGDLRVRVQNSLPARAEPPDGAPAPGGGSGLTALTERVRLAGGTLLAEPLSGMFCITAVLPWNDAP